MANAPEFKYAPMFQMGKDDTEYYLLTKDYVSVGEFEGHPVLKVAPEGLTAMANAAFRDVSFMLRRSHNEQVAKILHDPEASDNDKYVALTFLCAMRKWHARAFFRSVRIRVRPSSMAKKASRCGPVIATKRLCRKVSIRLIPKKTCVTARMPLLSMYEEVNTSATSRHKSTSKPPKEWSTVSCA